MLGRLDEAVVSPTKTPGTCSLFCRNACVTTVHFSSVPRVASWPPSLRQSVLASSHPMIRLPGRARKKQEPDAEMLPAPQPLWGQSASSSPATHSGSRLQAKCFRYSGQLGMEQFHCPLLNFSGGGDLAFVQMQGATHRKMALK